MKKIMFNDKYGLTKAVLEGRKTMTRRIVKGEIPLGNWEETEKYAHYKVGEVVAIAQAYRDIYNDEYHIGLYGRTAGWTNKMFVKADLMPHHIKVTNIRIEHLQNISNEDCLKEGVVNNTIGYYVDGLKCKDLEEEAHIEMKNGKTLKLFPTPRESFASIINGVSGKGTWDSNPLVWVYEFELVD